jgi:hypothetical protein
LTLPFASRFFFAMVTAAPGVSPTLLEARLATSIAAIH